jgi:hypothetical protein
MLVAERFVVDTQMIRMGRIVRKYVGSFRRQWCGAVSLVRLSAALSGWQQLEHGPLGPACGGPGKGGDDVDGHGQLFRSVSLGFALFCSVSLGFARFCSVSLCFRSLSFSFTFSLSLSLADPGSH